MSGRRSSSSEGTPAGIAGGAASNAAAGIENSDATGQKRNRVLVLSAQDSEAGIPRLRRFHLGFRLRDGFIRIEARPVQTPRQAESLPIRAHRGIENLFQSVLRAKLVAIRRQIRRAGLRRERIRLHGVSDAAKQVRLPGSLERH
jgi:hypothetical protein